MCLQEQGRQWFLIEVETVEHVVSHLIPRCQGAQAESLLHECQERRELVLRVADITLSGEWRDDEQGNPGAQSGPVDMRRWHVIVESPAVIPCNEHHSGVPIRSAHNGVELLYRPILARADAVGWMLAHLTRDQP